MQKDSCDENIFSNNNPPCPKKSSRRHSRGLSSWTLLARLRKQQITEELLINTWFGRVFIFWSSQASLTCCWFGSNIISNNLLIIWISIIIDAKYEPSTFARRNIRITLRATRVLSNINTFLKWKYMSNYKCPLSKESQRSSKPFNVL